MLLAEGDHHTSPRGQTQARSGEEVRVELHGHDPEQPHPQHELFDVFDEEPGGSRPPCLGEPRGPQERVQHRTVEQFADVVPMVQILDIPVPQIVDELVATLLHFDMQILEQIIAVPKISSSSRCSRTVLMEPQTAEQFVEVPPDDVAKFPLIEPIADIPALRGVFKLFSQRRPTR